MASYEILTIINGNLSESEAVSELNKLTKTINKSQDFKQINIGLKDLAYKIKGYTKGWYFQLNFISSIPKDIFEFDRITKINKNVIRHLIINLDKDYGAKALKNKKKVDKAAKKAEIYKKKMEQLAIEKENFKKMEQQLQINESEIKEKNHE